MKKLILSLAFAGAIIVATTACNSTKNTSESTDSVGVDTTMMMPVDTIPADTVNTPPDTNSVN